MDKKSIILAARTLLDTITAALSLTNQRLKQLAD